MSEKKGFFASLFGGNKSGGCCSMEIVEEPKKSGGCCDMEIVPEETGCGCGGVCCGKSAETESVETESTEAEAEQADILILGPGCRNCQGLEQNVREALKKMGRDAEIAHVTDFGKIGAYGIMSTPGLVVKGKVLSSGKVLKAEAMVELLEKNL